jgi:hypothetical protein
LTFTTHNLLLNIFYYRHCLWILGNATTLASSGSIWSDLVRDAKDRGCFFNASRDNGISRVIAKQRDLDRVNVEKSIHISSSKNCRVWVLSLFTASYYLVLVFFYLICYALFLILCTVFVSCILARKIHLCFLLDILLFH